MNELSYIDTLDNGNSLLYFPHGGVMFYFEIIDRDSIRLHSVDTIGDVETDLDHWTPFEGLPATVRRAIIRSQYRMRDAKATLEGAMHG